MTFPKKEHRIIVQYIEELQREFDKDLSPKEPNTTLKGKYHILDNDAQIKALQDSLHTLDHYQTPDEYQKYVQKITKKIISLSQK